MPLIPAAVCYLLKKSKKIPGKVIFGEYTRSSIRAWHVMWKTTPFGRNYFIRGLNWTNNLQMLPRIKSLLRSAGQITLTIISDQAISANCPIHPLIASQLLTSQVSNSSVTNEDLPTHVNDPLQVRCHALCSSQ